MCWDKVDAHIRGFCDTLVKWPTDNTSNTHRRAFSNYFPSEKESDGIRRDYLNTHILSRPVGGRFLRDSGRRMVERSRKTN